MEKAQDETSAAGGVSALSAGLEGWRWEEAKGPWASGLVLFVGKWPVGSAGYVSRTKGESKNYAAKSRLPGLKGVLEHFETMELAKDRVEKATRYWLRNLLSNATSHRSAACGASGGLPGYAGDNKGERK